ncbi:MAG: hypothetical protein A2504_04395 [Bdellovibrionales bacterium RIFOXYD12_FULL_39_22]|nr:MAG: hypothetical protein A2385_07430 [Bdellovibrionales bacterium RIFOXYB1_FULL_39_21]OFZ42091.1 MAG: hypothetical protein A2485_09400 [Bdellovibrionales bacterium RIFOXYC12_FULL_39_17]OFZ50807.1 MAG: hypothetical protein A2404_06350 [Bdellovibrionales bacterium RIFOXYC1_FULL_39_130]OFZ78030.1 MAG: hypothetical protein A2560_01520 [Bdellovibrionales bacterium RIFOXYD1_FULL_39_84]OFZ93534.1 MAG: hypothetical protein A2504_04395 [Bdellovibrionales bacterium RIFOXYD12_FULL_39_22]HLE10344.1 hy
MYIHVPNNTIVIALLLLLPGIISSQDNTPPQKNVVGQKIIYEYKKKEFIDLGNLEVKGTILAPGDISVQTRKRKEFNRNLFNRDDFNDKCTSDLKNLR